MPQELIEYAGCDGLIGKIIFTSEKDLLKAMNSQEIHNRINYYFNHLQTLAHTKLFGEKELHIYALQLRLSVVASN